MDGDKENGPVDYGRMHEDLNARIIGEFLKKAAELRPEVGVGRFLEALESVYGEGDDLRREIDRLTTEVTELRTENEELKSTQADLANLADVEPIVRAMKEI